MRFFSRCRILANILLGLSVLIGIGLCFYLPEIMGDISLVDASQNRRLFVFLMLVLLWLLLVIAVIALKCIVRDAQEDLTAVMRYTMEKPGNLGDEDSSCNSPRRRI